MVGLPGDPQSPVWGTGEDVRVGVAAMGVWKEDRSHRCGDLELLIAVISMVSKVGTLHAPTSTLVLQVDNLHARCQHIWH